MQKPKKFEAAIEVLSGRQTRVYYIEQPHVKAHGKTSRVFRRHYQLFILVGELNDIHSTDVQPGKPLIFVSANTGSCRSFGKIKKIRWLRRLINTA